MSIEDNIYLSDFDFINHSSNIKLPTEETIRQKYGLNILVETIPGGHNNVRIFRNSMNNKKYSLRKSNEYYFFLKDNEFFFNRQLLDRELGSNLGEKAINFRRQIERTKNNYINASTLELSPQLYFYGFVKELLPNNVTLFYNLIISEAYDMDLQRYFNNISNTYERNNGILTYTDYFIASEIINCMYKTCKLMSVICYDVKPGNCVVKFGEKINEQNRVERYIKSVKLIDWSGDFCIKESSITKGSKSDKIFFVPFLLSIMFTALHFLFFSNFNILSGFFLKKEDGMTLEDKYKLSMSELFCNSPYSNKYKHLANHYFDDYMDVMNEDCYQKFENLFRHSKLLKPNDGGRKKKNKTKKTKRNNI